MDALKRVEKRLVFLQSEGNAIRLFDLSQDGLLLQTLSSTGEAIVRWCSHSNCFIAVTSCLVIVYGRNPDGKAEWAEVHSFPVTLRGNYHEASLSYPHILLQSSEEAICMNVISGVRWSRFSSLSSAVRGRRLSLSGLFLLGQTESRNSADRSSNNIIVYSVSSGGSRSVNGTLIEEEDMKRVEIDTSTASSSPIISVHWRYRATTSTHELLSVIFADGTLAVYCIYHEKQIEEDGILAIALNALRTARSLAASDNDRTSPPPPSMAADVTQTEPRASLVPCFALLAVMPSSTVNRIFSTSSINNSTSSILSMQWVDTTMDAASMIEENSVRGIGNSDSQKSSGTSSKGVLSPVSKKTKKVDTAVQSYWLAVLCSTPSSNDVAVAIFRLHFHGPSHSFQFDFSTNVAFVHTIAMNSSLSLDHSQRQVSFTAVFSSNFGRMRGLEMNTVQVLGKSADLNASWRVIQALYLKHRRGHVEVLKERNFLASDAGSQTFPCADEHSIIGSVISFPSKHERFLVLGKDSQLRTLTFLAQDSGTMDSPPSDRRYATDRDRVVVASCGDRGSSIEVIVRDTSDHCRFGDHAFSHRDFDKQHAFSLEDLHHHRSIQNRDGMDSVYYVDIIPDEQQGLGLRLVEETDFYTGRIKVIIVSFKQHTVTREPLAAEQSGKIELGDEVIGANNVSFDGKSQSYVIQTMKGILANNHGNTLRLVMRRGQPPSADNTESQQLPLDTKAESPLKSAESTDSICRVETLSVSAPGETFSIKLNQGESALDVSPIPWVDTATGAAYVDIVAVIARSESLRGGLSSVTSTFLQVFRTSLSIRYSASTSTSAPTITTTPASSSGTREILRLNEPVALTTVRQPKDQERFGGIRLQATLSMSDPAVPSICSIFAAITHSTSSEYANSSSNSRPLPVLTTVKLQVRADNSGQGSNSSRLVLEGIPVECCRSVSMQSLHETFAVQPSMYSRTVDHYASLHTKFTPLSAPPADTDLEGDGETISSPVSKKTNSIMKSSHTTNIFAATNCYLSVAPQADAMSEKALVSLLNELLSLHGPHLLHSSSSLTSPVMPPHLRRDASNSSADILNVLLTTWQASTSSSSSSVNNNNKNGNSNPLRKLQSYLQSKTKELIDGMGHDIVQALARDRNALQGFEWLVRSEQATALTVGELDVTSSALYLAHHLAEMVQIAAQVYCNTNSNNSDFLSLLLPASSACLEMVSVSSSTSSRFQGHLDFLSILTSSGQKYLRLDSFGMRSVWQAIAKRSYVTSFLHAAVKLESIKSEMFLRGKRKAALLAHDHGDADYERTLTTLAMDFSIGTSSEKIKEKEEAQLHELQSQFVPLHASMQSVAHAFFSKAQSELFTVFIDCFNTLGHENDLQRYQMLQELGQTVSFVPAPTPAKSTASADNSSASETQLSPALQQVDALTYAAQTKVSLWLHDLEPLNQWLLRSALRRFKTHKSAMEVFLDMVIIGKTETLMQLARTDASSSGKQLYALLLQVDEAFNPFNSTTNRSKQDSDSSEDDSSDSDDERDPAKDDAVRIAALTQKLRKNATALVRKQRYREAAAVFLLCPTAAMVKSALNLLTVQYNQPFLAHLVARCLEYRIYGHGEISQQKLEKYALQASVLSNYEALQARAGCVHGLYTATLIEQDLLPSIWRTMDLAQQAKTSVLNPIIQQERLNSAFYHLEGLPCLQLATLCALWTQKPTLIRATMIKCMEYLEEHLQYQALETTFFASKTVGSNSDNPGLNGSNNNSGGGINRQQILRKNDASNSANSASSLSDSWLHETHMSLLSVCGHDFSAEDIYIVHQYLQATWGRAHVLSHKYWDLMSVLPFFEVAARFTGDVNVVHRQAALSARLYTLLEMPEHVLRCRMQQQQEQSCGSSISSVMATNAYFVHCQQFQKRTAQAFALNVQQVTAEITSAKRQAQEHVAAQLALLQQQQQHAAAEAERARAGNKESTSPLSEINSRMNEEVSEAPKMSFNFASMMSRPSAASATSSASATTAASTGMLDDSAFFPPTRSGASTVLPSKRTAPRSMLDMDDNNYSQPIKSVTASNNGDSIPTRAAASAKKVTSAPRSMLDDDFGYAPARPGRNTSSAPSASSESATTRAPPVRSMLDMFDDPPPVRGRPAGSSTASSSAPPSATGIASLAGSASDVPVSTSTIDESADAAQTSKSISANFSKSSGSTTAASSLDPFNLQSSSQPSALDLFDNPRPRRQPRPTPSSTSSAAISKPASATAPTTTSIQNITDSTITVENNPLGIKEAATSSSSSTSTMSMLSAAPVISVTEDPFITATSNKQQASALDLFDFPPPRRPARPPTTGATSLPAASSSAQPGVPASLPTQKESQTSTASSAVPTTSPEQVLIEAPSTSPAVATNHQDPYTSSTRSALDFDIPPKQPVPNTGNLQLNTNTTSTTSSVAEATAAVVTSDSIQPEHPESHTVEPSNVPTVGTTSAAAQTPVTAAPSRHSPEQTMHFVSGTSSVSTISPTNLSPTSATSAVPASFPAHPFTTPSSTSTLAGKGSSISSAIASRTSAVAASSGTTSSTPQRPVNPFASGFVPHSASKILQGQTQPSHGSSVQHPHSNTTQFESSVISSSSSASSAPSSAGLADPTKKKVPPMSPFAAPANPFKNK